MEAEEAFNKLLLYAEQFEKEARLSLSLTTDGLERTYQRGVVTGVTRIVRLIKRQKGRITKPNVT